MPATAYVANCKPGELRELKRRPLPGYDPANYVADRVWVTARDGAKVPVSLV